MNKTNIFLLALVAVLCCLFAVACDKDPTTYTVTFDSAGGDKVPSQTVVVGEIVSKPNNPTNENAYGFKDWRMEDGSQYDFSAPVNGDLTLYATWYQTKEELEGDFFSKTILATFVESLEVPDEGFEDKKAAELFKSESNLFDFILLAIGKSDGYGKPSYIVGSDGVKYYGKKAKETTSLEYGANYNILDDVIRACRIEVGSSGKSIRYVVEDLICKVEVFHPIEYDVLVSLDCSLSIRADETNNPVYYEFDMEIRSTINGSSYEEIAPTLILSRSDGKIYYNDYELNLSDYN